MNGEHVNSEWGIVKLKPENSVQRYQKSYQKIRNQQITNQA